MVRAIVPAGYMVAPSPDGQSLSIVICTGHGRLILDSHQPGKSAPANSSSSAGGACPFAGGHSPVPGVDLVAATPAGYFTYSRAVAPLSRDQHPGRGLAAPPPPTTGPPSIS